MLHFEPGFHGFVGLGLLYNSVKFWPKRSISEHFQTLCLVVVVGGEANTLYKQSLTVVTDHQASVLRWQNLGLLSRFDLKREKASYGIRSSQKRSGSVNLEKGSGL